MKKNIFCPTVVLITAMMIFLSSCSHSSLDKENTTPQAQTEQENVQKEQVISLETQGIELDGVQNARQLGGYICADGRKIKDGVLLRSAALGGLTDEGAKTLAEKYNLKYIFDFRMDTERQALPDKAVEGAENLSLPVFSYTIYGDEILSEIKEAAESGNSEQTQLILAKNHGLLKIYKNMLLTEEGKQAYKSFFDTLLTLEDGEAVLWHCSQGKDRAGMAAVLLLYALGADEETITADYLLTNDSYAEIIAQGNEKAAELGLNEDETKEYIGFLAGVDKEFLDAAIESLNENYGSVQNYLKDGLELSDEDIETLRKKFLE